MVFYTIFACTHFGDKRSWNDATFNISST